MVPERQRRLSKSKLLSWLQCPKRLWLEVHHEQVALPDELAERRFTIGHNVGEVARRLQPGGVLIGSPENPGEALKQTSARIEGGSPLLFEPAFQHGGVLIRADILKKRGAGYEVREVKASGSVKDYHYWDAAIQAWVLRGAGLKLDSIFIQHVDTSFVYPGGGDYRSLFAAEAVDDEIRPLAKEVVKWVDNARITLAGPEPKIKTGKHCGEPFDCPCYEYCSGKEPQTKYPLKILPRPGRAVLKLVEEGCRDVRDIPPGRLTENQERVRRITKSGRAELSPEAKKAVRALPYPRYHFDFETVQFAVPIWSGTRPYQQIPFQWSCHIERVPGKIEHRGHLDTTGNSPMQSVAESLLRTLGDEGPILAHYASFEKGRIEDLATLVPKRGRELRKLILRFVDTLLLVRDYYYHPAMMGSWSLKAVLPTIAPDLDYENVGEVQDGGAASEAYLEIISSDSPKRKTDLREALERYCERDTLALVRLLRFLETGK
jgi:hypothetical protein